MHYHPSVPDVLSVKNVLMNKLPLEIVDTIIDLAEYWPHTTVTTSPPDIPRWYSLPQLDRDAVENQLVLRTYPLGYVPKEYHITELSSQTNNYLNIAPIPGPNVKDRPQELTKIVLYEWTTESRLRGKFPCRKITFTIQSHDQGWGGDASEGIYENSYTWFDVGKEEICVLPNQDLSTHRLSDQSCSFNSQTITEPASARSQGPFFVIDTPENKESKCINSKTLICASQTISPRTVSETVASRNTDNPSSNIYTFHHELLPDSITLQRNARAQKDTREHIITWSYNDNVDPESAAGDELEKNGRGRATASGDFVRNLRPGEIVTVWKKFRFPGWANHVKMVKIDLFWAV